MAKIAINITRELPSWPNPILFLYLPSLSTKKFLVNLQNSAFTTNNQSVTLPANLTDKGLAKLQGTNKRCAGLFYSLSILI